MTAGTRIVLTPVRMVVIAVFRWVDGQKGVDTVLNIPKVVDAWWLQVLIDCLTNVSEVLFRYTVSLCNVGLNLWPCGSHCTIENGP